MTHREKRVSAKIGSHGLAGDIWLPSDSQGLVIFAHGSGSSRRSPRNAGVASSLNERGFATLLMDLLTEQEAADRLNVFDISLLGARVGEAIDWAGIQPAIGKLPIGLFGASTGAAAALVAAANHPYVVGAVVSRGGRPDLADAALAEVRAPTLLIVGSADYGVVELNEKALAELTCSKQLVLVPGATHLFEERGAMERVVELAADWFETHLCR